MNREQFSKIIKFLYVIIWIIILIHLYKGFGNLLHEDLEIWQIMLISFQLTFEVVVLAQINLLLLGICIVLVNPLDHSNIKKLTEFPIVDIVIPIRRVDIHILEDTLIGFSKQSYPVDKMNIYIADDTPEVDKIKNYQQLANKYKVNYISKPENKKYKSGMLNLILPELKSEYIAFFDFDQIPQTTIIEKFLEILQSRQEIDFVQAKKVFRNLDNIFKIWSALLYGLYFEVFERSKQFGEIVLFAGSTACFRRNSIDDVGGIPEHTFTEDNGLSVNLLMNGSKGYYYDKIGSIGNIPPTFSLQIAQLWRWSNGASHVLRLNIRKLLTSRKLPLAQRLDIIATLGISPLVVFIYIYGLSFIPLLVTGVDSSRLVIFNISSTILVPLFAAITYTILVGVAIVLAEDDNVSEFKLSHLPGFLFIALASNLLVIMSGLTGIFGKFGPNSKYGKWTRKVRIKSIAVFGIIIGVITEYFAIQWFKEGFASASLLIILGTTLFPSILLILFVPNLLKTEQPFDSTHFN
ncbi:MAG: Cellulose synthase catalytic subunit [UDP-forming] [Candidatus Heimdallarchaeota archaeon LC_2]|nr:MAG: Cellulose synthase catalytic subunit [UDP-forming] [Candidatus Heimdallarchaeota archaeon LC_2]